MNLTQWQKEQVALLYHFSSLSYLEGLRDRLRALRVFAEGLLDDNKVKGRDKFLKSKQWGSRNTGENWENNAWPFLSDFQRSVAQHIVDRRSNTYHRTGAYQCSRGIAESSVQWMTPQEQDQFDRMFEELSGYALYIDETMDRTVPAAKWDDFGMAMAWQNHADQFPVLPKLRAVTDISAASGRLPPKTGVYVSMDDPHATPQFAWTGSPDGRLLDATSFNETGKAALAAVGREKLWVDGDAMLRFVLQNLSNPDLTSDPFFDESKTPELAPSLVARNAFTGRPSHWCYVELVSHEVEQIETKTPVAKLEAFRCASGEYCQREGFYFAPADMHSRRYFRVGERFPELTSAYGQTIWQSDGS
ncbi:hypothetical protein [Massilia sp. GCM10023247]|uniref:hypothetical protein n=1 Tax=Massilia sp. GCM10023247 TaxID=3252643 RepID=UPI00360AB7AB